MPVPEIVRLALIGGGPGSFIGPVHRMAAELDGRIKLVAGIFSRDADKSQLAGAQYGVDPARVYPDMAALVRGEQTRADGVELVAIATPNASHFGLARDALAAGLHVMCDKPATATLQEVQELAKLVAAARTHYGLTYTYTGYPMVREAREQVRAGALGEIRKIVVEYPQGWLSAPVEHDANRQAAWRTDPAQAGLGGAIGDIGVHAFQLAEYVSDCRVTQMLPDLGHVVPGRTLDDDCNVLLRFAGGARGVLHASQISTGARNGLRLRIWGSLGGLDWSHESPDRLTFDWADRPTQIYHAGAPYLSAAALHACRLPSGHPEGLIEAFANLYRDFAALIRGETPLSPVPGIADGLRGMTFVARAAASPSGGAWINLD